MSLFLVSGPLSRLAVEYLEPLDALICHEQLPFNGQIAKLCVDIDMDDAIRHAVRASWVQAIEWAKLNYSRQVALHNIMIDAVRGGHFNIAMTVKSYRDSIFPEDLRNLGNSVRCIKLLIICGFDCNALMYDACRHGQLIVMRLVRKSLHLTDKETILNCAAMHGQIRAMKLARKWGARCFPSVAVRAWECGQTKTMQLAQKWQYDEIASGHTTIKKPIKTSQ